MKVMGVLSKSVVETVCTVYGTTGKYGAHPIKLSKSVVATVKFSSYANGVWNAFIRTFNKSVVAKPHKNTGIKDFDHYGRSWHLL